VSREPGSSELDPSRPDFPVLTAPAAETPVASRRRRRSGRARAVGGTAPYALLLPAAAVVAAVLAYPLYILVKLSFQRYGLPELIKQQGTWVGLDNYTKLIRDNEFWRVLIRTFLFMAGCVSATMVLGTLIALLLAKLGQLMRLLLTTGLVLVWAMPVVVAANIWLWMVDYEFGVLNYTLTKLHVGSFVNHDWFSNPKTGFLVIGSLVVWGAIPFVAITLYAGLSQLPREMVEAAEMDGANSWRVFRDVTVPLLKPIFVILISLSIIWDFQVFSQVWLLRDGRPTSEYYVMAVYSFVESFGISQYGYGSAIAIVMVLTMFVVAFVHIRQMVRIGEVQ
jgi:N,N'-diacetylchitobiose transport system permease protein